MHGIWKEGQGFWSLEVMQELQRRRWVEFGGGSSDGGNSEGVTGLADWLQSENKGEGNKYFQKAIQFFFFFIFFQFFAMLHNTYAILQNLTNFCDITKIWAILSF